MKNVSEKIGKWWNEYWDWLMSFPTGIGLCLAIVTVTIPALLFVNLLFGILDTHFEAKCLDSELARRWSPTHRICEEYHDGEWVKADLSGDNIYYYNDTASREH